MNTLSPALRTDLDASTTTLVLVLADQPGRSPIT